KKEDGKNPKAVQEIEDKYFWSKSFPAVVILPPEMQDVEVDAWSVPRDWSIVNKKELVDFICNHVEWQPPPHLPRLLKWTPLAAADQLSASTKKPILYFFTRLSDFHCDVVREELFQEKDIAVFANDHFICVELADHSRVAGNTPKTVRDLETKYQVSSFP